MTMSAMVSGRVIQDALLRAWSSQETARRLGVTTMTLFNWRLRDDDPIPSLHIPGEKRNSVRFLPDEVRSWARRNRRPLNSSR